MEYRICEANSVAKLQEQVNQLIREGWRPVGGIAAAKPWRSDWATTRPCCWIGRGRRPHRVTGASHRVAGPGRRLTCTSPNQAVCSRPGAACRFLGRVAHRTAPAGELGGSAACVKRTVAATQTRQPSDRKRVARGRETRVVKVCRRPSQREHHERRRKVFAAVFPDPQERDLLLGICAHPDDTPPQIGVRRLARGARRCGLAARAAFLRGAGPVSQDAEWLSALGETRDGFRDLQQRVAAKWPTAAGRTPCTSNAITVCSTSASGDTSSDLVVELQQRLVGPRRWHRSCIAPASTRAQSTASPTARRNSTSAGCQRPRRSSPTSRRSS